MKVSLTAEEGLDLLRQYCNFQERCHKEVRSKGLKLGFYGATLEELISQMVSEGLLNEERYARSLARGKFRNNQWGKIKIVQTLKQHDVSEYSIRKALTELDEAEYRKTLAKLIQAKAKTLSGEIALFQKKQKIINYLLQKGFEYEVIQEVLDAE
ncbi:MAG: regulatory protein RecX [Saprospiraceae bacterium]|nr:regulatory protein RecX [Saprospiraceae bacterium]